MSDTPNSQDSASESSRLPGSVVRLGWISFFADVCSEMAYPILPSFVTGVLRTPIWIFGAIEGVAESLVSLVKGWAGFQSDRAGRRVPFIQSGYFASSLGKPLIGLATAWPGVLAGRCLDRFGKGIRTAARDAMIAEAVHPSQYGRAYGFHRAMDTCGALIGVVVALILVRWVSLRDILIWAVVPGLIAFALTLTLREIPRAAVESVPQIDQSRRSHRELWESVRATASPGYWNAMVILALFAFANSSDTFLLLRAKEAGLDDAQTTLAYLGYNVVAAAASYTSGVWGDRFGHRRVLLIGLAVFVVAYAGFAWTPSSAWLIPLFVTYGLYYALTHGIAKAIVAIHSPIESRASAIGAVAMVTGIATLMGNLTTGALWSWAGSSAALLASSAIALCALAIGVLWKPTEATSSQVDSNQ